MAKGNATGRNGRSPSSNVAGASLASPFRYPGGKTWLVPRVMAWLDSMGSYPTVFVEPFAGGGIVSLNVALSGRAGHVAMAEIDPDVGAVWSVALQGPDDGFERLCAAIEGFVVDREAVVARLSGEPEDDVERAFRTILRNRMNRGGIMARRASLLNAGEKNKGLLSRWYPGTLVRRLRAIRAVRERVTFYRGDAFEEIARHASNPRAAFFIDPPYTAGGGKVGSRLYTHSEIDHDRLFAVAAALAGPAVLTYDDVAEVRDLARRHGLSVEAIQMRGTHHDIRREVAIGRGEAWGTGPSLELEAA